MSELWLSWAEIMTKLLVTAPLPAMPREPCAAGRNASGENIDQRRSAAGGLSRRGIGRRRRAGRWRDRAGATTMVATMPMAVLRLRALRLSLGRALLLRLRGRVGGRRRLVGRRFLIGGLLCHLLLLPLLEQLRLAAYVTNRHGVLLCLCHICGAFRAKQRPLLHEIVKQGNFRDFSSFLRKRHGPLHQKRNSSFHFS
jgi:hypothetical protein